MAVMSNDGLVTVDSGGCVRLWEMAMYQLGDSVNKWQQMIGDGQERPLQVGVLCCTTPGYSSATWQLLMLWQLL